MLLYFPIPARAQALCGVAYMLRSAEPTRLHLSALMPQLQLILSGAARQSLGPDGAMQAMAPVTLVGATHRATQVELAAGTQVIGVGLVPQGMRLATGIPADRIADQMIEAGSIWGDGPIMRLLDRTGSAPDGAGATRAVFDFIVAAAERTSRAADPRMQQIEHWLGHAGSSSIDRLVERLDISARHVARLTLQSHGASPKLLEMKYRALRLAAAIAIGKQAPSLIEAASSDGYYDQSHRIRDFRRFVGWTPAQFERDHAMFARTMLTGRWEAGARSPTTLWS